MHNITVVLEMIDWIEENMEEGPMLQKISKAVGYSPWYCSCMFHDITGMTLKSYVAGRRLAIPFTYHSIHGGSAFPVLLGSRFHDPRKGADKIGAVSKAGEIAGLCDGAAAF